MKQMVDAYGWALGGKYPSMHVETGEVFFFPHDTLIMHPQEARKMGIKSESDLYGGLVPEPFLATKVIVHPLVSNTAQHPHMWSDTFAQTRKQDGCMGYAVFSKEDARKASAQLLQEYGAIRGKDPTRSGGRGQIVIRTHAEIEAAIVNINQKNLEKYGYIFETHLQDTEILSIGQSKVNGDIISYYGLQRQKCIGEERAEYAGTDLVVVRGGYNQLFQIGSVTEHLHQAIEQVVRFHRALSYYEEILASRMNVDVVQGYDEKAGNWLSILTDPALRPGGAPELQAQIAMKQDPEAKVVYASSYDGYYQEGEEKPVLPDGATVHFHGRDDEFKPQKTILIYSIVHSHGNYDVFDNHQSANCN
ncbi:MAG: DUF3182 family protein [Chloroflexi bacterium]|nr:DUF3182 family protein [Chloroflexota bacterium]